LDKHKNGILGKLEEEFWDTPAFDRISSRSKAPNRARETLQKRMPHGFFELFDLLGETRDNIEQLTLWGCALQGGGVSRSN
jgi:hypothetical protein